MKDSQKILFSVALLFISGFSLSACNKTYPDNNTLEVKIESQEVESNVSIQKESEETLEYKKVKEQIKITENKVQKIRNQRDELLEEFQPEAVEVKEISNKLEGLEEKLSQLKSELDIEAKKFGRKPEHFQF